MVGVVILLFVGRKNGDFSGGYWEEV